MLDLLLLSSPLSYSLSVTQPENWDLRFKSGSGSALLDGQGKEAKLRRSWVRELRIDKEVLLRFEMGLGATSSEAERLEVKVVVIRELLPSYLAYIL